MSGEAFSLTPDVVVTLEPEYYNVITPSESAKKEYMNIASTPVERYELHFHGLSNTDRDTLLGHYKDQYGGYYSFSWQSVPSYIGSGANITGRWVDGTLKMEPFLGKYWKCSITFEKAV